MRFDKILAITALIVASTTVAAASPADMTIFPKESSTEVNSFTSYEVTVENTGTVKDFYTLSSRAKEVRIAPREVELEPGQSKKVNVWYNPSQDKEAGTYSFSVKATSRGTGNSFSVEGTVNVIKDHEVEVSAEPTSRRACLGEQVSYDIRITNEGIQKEEFSLSTDYGQLSRNSVSLEDDETQTVTLTASAGQPVERNFNVVAASKTSYAQDIQNMDFQSVVCYDSEVSITPQNQEVAAKTQAEYQVTVRNTGTKADTFTLSTSRGELEETELTVNGKSTESTTLSYTPTSLGNQRITVEAAGESTSSSRVTAQVYNGMDMDVSFERSSRSACEKGSATYTATVENNGEAEETFSLEANRGNLSREEVELEPGESREVEITVSSSEVREGGTVNVNLAATATTFGEPRKTATSMFTSSNCYDLEMNVVPRIASAGENRSVVYEVQLENPGTRENTYHITQDGPSWISIKPEEVTIPAGGSDTVYMYAGIPFEKEGRVQLQVTGEGNQVRKSQTVKLVIGEDIKDAIKSDRNALTGSFSRFVSGISDAVTGSSNIQKVLASIVIGLAISLVVLYSEW
ncbi:MAG: hypothetical protein ABEJ07_03770 [Candidatus Nanohaloarchaea archaeon]